MRKLSTTFASLLLFATLSFSQQKTDRELNGLIGPVKSITMETESPGKPRVKAQMINFDAAGRKTEEIGYSEQGTVARRTVYAYNSKGNLIEETDYDAAGGSIGKTTHRYDGNGYKLETVSYSNDGQVMGRTGYVRDSAGRLIEETYKGTKDTWFDRTTQYVYDEQGRLVAEKSNSAGLLGPKKSDGSDFRVVATYRYDDRGLLVEETKTSVTGQPIPTKYAYDSNGKLTQKTSRSIGPPTTVVFDDKGNPTSEHREGFRYGPGSGSETKYVYEYDSRGNWTKRTITRTTTKQTTEKIPATSLSYPTSQPVTELIQTNYRTITYY